MKQMRIFISSVQKEFAIERAALRDYLNGDPLLRRFFDFFLFEEVPAADRRADEVYLDEVKRCDIYLGLFGNDYGYEDEQGISPTHHEYNHATQLQKNRLIFVKGADDSTRNPKMLALIQQAGNQLIRRRFATAPERTDHRRVCRPGTLSGRTRTDPLRTLRRRSMPEGHTCRSG